MELVYTIPAAIGLGALHALEPGHGKGVISAYLIAIRGKIKDAMFIGIISAITHTISIVILSLAASAMIQWLAPDQLIHWIELIAGILITLIGAKILYGHYYPRILSLGSLAYLQKDRLSEQCDHHHHHHNHENQKHHKHDHQSHHSHHQHADEAPTSILRLIVVGFFTGIIPCPSAVAIFLAAIAAGQIPLGIGLVSAFSLGSAITMCAVGILVVRIGRTIKNRGSLTFARSLNMVSSLIIIGIGLLVTINAVGQFA
ncbi:HoxN/HupN/NixA family nickel/cobalt transporter [Paenibacillus eucommiae]|uniref:Nickel/cobalt efflux system n=1 Tax=Paenibacillus eucommiae TaxID=1355755 RepID=A0ABS4IR47_9BACL|nr:sulfite exporter TauE/SafE family protein [Paenibacillus eucommiae]MBP1990037.1 ABC-type nickel/cobalt efflux system permease component RcnA [Paenibacillus eucommiae]